jgi:hypothetical protein
MPSGKMFLGALLLVKALESSWGAVGAAEVRAGAIVECDASCAQKTDVAGYNAV